MRPKCSRRSRFTSLLQYSALSPSCFRPKLILLIYGDNSLSTLILLRFQVQGKLAPRYIGPYQVLKKVGAVAYCLELLEEMSDIHPVFHVSQLRRCLRIPEVEHVPVETIDLQPDLRYQEIPVKILDTVTRRTRNSEVRICRIQ